MRATDPQQFKTLKLPEYADRLSSKTLLELTKAQGETQTGGAGEAKWATDNDRIESGLRQLGYGKGDEKKRGQFRLRYEHAQAAFIQKQRREPSQDEADTLLRELVRHTALNPESLEHAEAFETYSGTIAESDRQLVRDAYLRKRGRLPTEAEVVQLVVKYRQGGGQ
jgi:hypothetical protein